MRSISRVTDIPSKYFILPITKEERSWKFVLLNFYFYVQSNIDVRSVFISSCLQEGSCLIYVNCVCLRIVVSNTYFDMVFIRHVYPIFPVSLEFSFLIAPSVFSNVYLSVIVCLVLYFIFLVIELIILRLTGSDYTFGIFKFFISNLSQGPGGSMSQTVGLPNNSCKPITNTAWVRSRLCRLQIRVHTTRNCK